VFASSAKSRRGKATFDPSSKVRGNLRRRHRRRARRDPRLRDIFSARSTLLGVPVCEMTTRKRAVAARYSALCAGDETIKEQRGRCISVFGRACGADDVEAMPDFRNALERSAPRTAKGGSGKTPWPRSGFFDPVSVLQVVKILLYRMPGIVTPLLLSLARKVIAEFMNTATLDFTDCTLLNPSRKTLWSPELLRLLYVGSRSTRQSFTGIRGAKRRWREINILDTPTNR